MFSKKSVSELPNSDQSSLGPAKFRNINDAKSYHDIMIYRVNNNNMNKVRSFQVQNDENFSYQCTISPLHLLQDICYDAYLFGFERLKDHQSYVLWYEHHNPGNKIQRVISS